MQKGTTDNQTRFSLKAKHDKPKSTQREKIMQKNKIYGHPLTIKPGINYKDLTCLKYAKSLRILCVHKHICKPLHPSPLFSCRSSCL